MGYSAKGENKLLFKKLRSCFSVFLVFFDLFSVCSSGASLANSLDVAKDRVLLVGNDMLVPSGENEGKFLCEGSVKNVTAQKDGVDLCVQQKQMRLENAAELESLTQGVERKIEGGAPEKVSDYEAVDSLDFGSTNESSKKTLAQDDSTSINSEVDDTSKVKPMTSKEILLLFINVVLFLELWYIFDSPFSAICFIIRPSVFWYTLISLLNVMYIWSICRRYYRVVLSPLYRSVIVEFFKKNGEEFFDKIESFNKLRVVIGDSDKVYKLGKRDVLRKKLEIISSYMSCISERLSSVENDLDSIKNVPECKEKYKNCKKLLVELSGLCEKGFHVGYFDFLNWGYFDFLDEAISILEKLEKESSIFEQPQVVVISPFAKLNNIDIYSGMKVGKVAKRGIGQEKFNKSFLGKSSFVAKGVSGKVVQ